MNPLISIIIPVYNTERHLEKCLESVFNQTYKNIEIIVVNDYSPDNSEEIIKSYIQKDDRIIYLKNPTNAGTHETRKAGVLQARGEYILFLDSDDWFDLDACEKITKTIQQHSPDLIQISLKTLTKDSVKKANLLFNKLQGQKCFEELFVNNVYSSWGIGSKVVKKSLLEKVYQEIPNDVYLTNSEDFLLFYITAFLSTSFIGCPKAIYNYNCIEESGSNTIIKNRDSYLKWLDSLEKLFEILNTFKEKYNINQLYPEIKNETYNDYWIVNLFFQKTSLKDQQELFPIFCQKIGLEKVFDILIQYYPLEIIMNLIPEYQFKKTKTVKNIAFITTELKNGGAERVLSLLATHFVKNGYTVLIIAEDTLDEESYQISDNVIYKTWDKKNRYSLIKQYLQKYDIDTVILQDHWRKEYAYDLYYFYVNKQYNIVTCLHNTPIWCYYKSYSYSELIYQKIYDLADVMTCLSYRDKIYLDNMQKLPVIYMPNVLTFDPLLITPNSLKELNIIFIGRLDEEKNPLFLIDAFKVVLESVSEAKLYLVGDGSLKEEIVTRIHQLSIQDSVIITGYTTEVEQYYQKASINVLPSLFEGLPMVWLEAKAYGIPSVVFRMDSVELTHHEGSIIVEQNDLSGFTEALIKLLKDEQYRKEMGREARESLENFKTENTINKWEQLFGDLSNNTLINSPLLNLDKEYNTEEALKMYENLKFETFKVDYGVRAIYETPISKKQKIKNSIKNIIKFLFKKILPKNSLRYKKLKNLAKKIVASLKNS